MVPDFMSRLQSLNKVRSVVDMKMVSKFMSVGDRNYNPYYFDVNAHTENGIVYFPENVCWELKYPNFDIVGRTS